MFDDDDDDFLDDELIRIVSSGADTSSQYVIFTNSSDDLFAINVAKVEELVMNKDIVVTLNGDDCEVTSLGVTKIRDSVISIFNFDDWLGTKRYKKKDLKLIILLNHSWRRVGIVVKGVVGIQSIEAKMIVGHFDDEKIINILELSFAGKKRLCKIFDTDRMMADIFPFMRISEEDKVDKISLSASAQREIKKLVLFAEDSVLIQKAVAKLFDRLELNYEIYENGQLMLDRLERLDPSEISIIITDIEMPVMDGMTLMAQLKQKTEFANIPIVVNTNMANEAVVAASKSLGAKEVVRKLDLDTLHSMIMKYAI